MSGIDWHWCYECPKEAAALIEQLQRGSARWVPVAEAIADSRIQEVNPDYPVFARKGGQWYRLDLVPKLP
jgi:hypothetical protein